MNGKTISSVVFSPMKIAFGGLFGLCGLPLVLSIKDETLILLPLGTGTGSRNVYNFCQLKS